MAGSCFNLSFLFLPALTCLFPGLAENRGEEESLLDEKEGDKAEGEREGERERDPRSKPCIF